MPSFLLYKQQHDTIHSSQHNKKNAKKAIVTCLGSLGEVLGEVRGEEVTRPEATQINTTRLEQLFGGAQKWK
jgi:hypothetical protein